MLFSQKHDFNWGLYQLREVWTKNFKTSPTEEDVVEMSGDGEDSEDPSRGRQGATEVVVIWSESVS